MKNPKSQLARLTNLLANGTLPRSACSASFIATIAPLLDAGVVTEDKSGAGRRLVSSNPAALQAFIQHHFPNALVPAGSSSRVAGVARFRNTKAIASDMPEIVTVRTWQDEALRCAGKPINASEATGAHGVFAFHLADADRYTLHGSCALVENPAVFNRFEKLHLPPQLVIFGHGRSSNRLFDWLEAQTAADFHLLHLPDYDPVGLDEFIRLQGRLGSRVQLHIPNNLTYLFEHHSDTELLQKSSTQSLLAKLRLNQNDKIQLVLSLIEQHNAGLEQEALLVPQQSE